MTSGGREIGAGAIKARPFLPYYSLSVKYTQIERREGVLFGSLDQSTIDVW
jgi:hypothetical protein